MIATFPNPWPESTYQLVFRTTIRHVRVYSPEDHFEHIHIRMWPGPLIPAVESIDAFLRSFETKQVYHEWIANEIADRLFDDLQLVRIKVRLVTRLAKGTRFEIQVDSNDWSKQ